MRLNGGTLAAFALLAAGGPFAIDMYLPAFPAIAADLNTTPSLVQLTLSTFMVGMALGQLFVGALSDTRGRHRLLVIGAVVSVAASASCALTTHINLLIAARFILGLGSGACVVLARACVSDLAHGRSAARAFSIMMTIQGLAPVIAPILGGLLAEPIGWRGLFWVLTGLAALQLAVAVLVVRETLPAESRTSGGLKAFFGNLVAVLRNRRFVGYLLAFSFGFGGLFAYISASPFIIQGQLGLPPVVYSVVFALNSLGIVIGSMINARIVGRMEPHVLLRNATYVLAVSGVALLLVPQSEWLVLPLLFIVASSLGFILGNATALGNGVVRERSGTGSAVMGFAQFLVGGMVSPLVGLCGNPIIATGICITVCGAIAVGGMMMARNRV